MKLNIVSKIIPLVVFGLVSTNALAEGWVGAAASVTELESGGQITATIEDDSAPTTDAIIQNCAAGSCAQIAGDPSKVAVGLAASRISGILEATVKTSSTASGESVVQNCAAASCAQVGKAGGSW